MLISVTYLLLRIRDTVKDRDGIIWLEYEMVMPIVSHSESRSYKIYRSRRSTGDRTLNNGSDPNKRDGFKDY